MDAEMIILCDGVVIPQSKKEIDGGVAIAGGHILRIGARAELSDYLGVDTEVVEYHNCNLLEYLTQRDIQTKNSGGNVRYRGKHRFFKGFNEFIKEKTRRCDNDFEKIERHVFF